MKSMRFYILFSVVCVLGVGGLAAWHFGYLGQASYSEVQAEAAPIIAAINRYESDHHAFPETLSELVPKYLPSVPRPPRGAKTWDYHNSHNDHFEFEITTSNNRIWYNNRRGWAIGDANF